jgi:hypothetical protein
MLALDWQPFMAMSAGPLDEFNHSILTGSGPNGSPKR